MMQKDTINFISFKDQRLSWILCPILKYGGLELQYKFNKYFCNEYNSSWRQTGRIGLKATKDNNYWNVNGRFSPVTVSWNCGQGVHVGRSDFQNPFNYCWIKICIMFFPTCYIFRKTIQSLQSIQYN